MNYQSLTRKELINKLQELQREYNKLKTSGKKDIARQKLTEEALRESETRYRELFNNISSGVAIYEVSDNGNDFTFKDYNRAGERIDGDRKEDVIGKSIYQVRQGIKKFGLVEVLKRVFETGIPEHFPVRFYEDEKLKGWYDNFVYRLPAGEIAVVFDNITERVQTLEALNIEKENFRHSLDNSPVGIRITTMEGNTIYGNKALLSIYGFNSLEELRNTRQKDRYTPESYAQAQERKHQREKGDLSATDYEISIVRKNGEIRHLQVFRKEVLWDGIRQFQVIYLDITEQKRAISELHLNGEIMKNITEGVFLIRLDDETIIFTNPKSDEMFGYEHGEMIGKPFSIVSAPTDKNPEEIRQAVMNILNKRGEWHGETLNLKKDGSHFWCYVNLSLFDHPLYGKLLVSVHSDISDRKLAENKIKESETLRNVLLDNLPIVTLVLKKHTREIIACNKLAIEAGAVVGKTCYETLTNCNRNCPFCKAPDLWVSGKEQYVEAEYTGKHWEGRWIPLSEELYVHYIIDITERKKSEEQLLKSKELLENLNQRLNEIRENERAAISREIHDELGQSLTAIKLDLNQIFSYVSNNHEAVVKLDSIIDRISSTIKDVQRISSELRPGILDDLGLVSAIEWYCEEFEKRTGIRCSLKLDDPDYLDPQINLTFFRVLQEALTNVIRHSKASSVNIALHKSSGGTIMAIHDNGIGIPAEIIESHKSMGLINMRERVKQFKGNVEISLKKGSGTKLTVFIPS